jgi:pimeloyl-ACP methyl ester carboxylesterase
MRKKKPNKAIWVEEYVLINGIQQYLFHAGTNPDNPVLLFLHGGPGSPASLFAHAFQDQWEELFTVVHWDQRGAGKTLTKNPASYPTLALLLQDIREILRYLGNRYHQEKIILLGHSWGTVLGSLFIHQHPEEVAYYIGVGQVINKLASERLNYIRVKELMTQTNDQKGLKELAALGDYPGESLDAAWLKKSLRLRKLQRKYQPAIKPGASPFKTLRTSPLFRWSDLAALIKGNKANKALVDFLGTFDLNAEPAEYQVPVYYVVGEDDWQTPSVLAQEYLAKIHAPDKHLYTVPNAGHMPMIDQPALFLQILSEIQNRREKGKEG